jgi:hypothetical protein
MIPRVPFWGPQNPLVDHLREILPGAWSSDHRSHRARLDLGDRRIIVREGLTSGPHMVAHETGLGVDPVSHERCWEFTVDLPRIVASCVRDMLYRRPVHASDVPVWAHDQVRGLAVPRKHHEARAHYEALISEIDALKTV